MHITGFTYADHSRCICFITASAMDVMEDSSVQIKKEIKTYEYESTGYWTMGDDG
jgi:hypothetical protein